MNEEAFTTSLRIDATHPSLPGHFPGRPVVPGVVLLQRVATAFKQWRGACMDHFEVKFLSPLLPGQDALIELRVDGARARFAIRREHTVLARGIAECGS